MPPAAAASPDTIRILVATDSHVGYAERDPIRKDDSWRSFDEIMKLAKTEDVDMVLLAGDLFHDNQPSRKSMFQVMRSLRQNCLGEKPCELEMLSDPSDVLNGDHVNYEDPDINVAIPVFSIHGNHDDPTGEGHYCALDLLQVSGLLNYIGRIPESDKIEVKPVLLQKGQTKLALYGMSNVRDERLYRTFQEGKVKFFQPEVQKKDWYNIMAVHQNHHAHTETSYLPETFLPDFLDLVVWGHEHECLIDPRLNTETNFHVMQPGSSIATALVAGEAVSKHVAIVSITGRQMTTKNYRIKSVRPFITRDIVLADEPQFRKLARTNDNKSLITNELQKVVDKMIEEAIDDWRAAQYGDDELEDIPDQDVPLPLIRLRVEYTAPEGGTFNCENPQRFSSRFINRVANVKDVITFHMKKKGRSGKDKVDKNLPDESALAALEGSVRVDKLVHEFLGVQSLKILPQTPFGDAVTEFVKRDDKHIMEDFVDNSLATQVAEMMKLDEADEEDLDPIMEALRQKQEEKHSISQKKSRRGRLLPRPVLWDSDENGEWEDDPHAYEEIEEPSAPRRRRSRSISISINEDDDDASDVAPVKKAAPAKRAPAKKAPVRTRAPPKAKAPAKPKAPAKGRRKAVEISDEDEDEEGDVMMMNSPTPTTKSQPKRAAAVRGTAGRQTQLNFSQSQAPKTRTQIELSDDEILDDDAFEPVPKSSSRRR